ncbi:MAG: hypothetical protein AAF438_09710 [Pseudomonadota bacterium]
MTTTRAAMAWSSVGLHIMPPAVNGSAASNQTDTRSPKQDCPQSNNASAEAIIYPDRHDQTQQLSRARKRATKQMG